MYHFIYNPTSGQKRSNKNWKTIQAILDERQIPYQAHESKKKNDVENIVRNLTQQGAQDIIVLGGDGTLHEALNGLADPSACRLGLIPCGTGNDFAEKAGIPKQVEKALSLIIDGTAKETDYLEVGNRRCINVAGLGMDVEVLELCEKGKMQGKLKYLISLIRCLFKFKGCKVTIKSEGREESHSVLLAAVCNGTQFGGGIQICPDAEIDDGKMGMVAVDCIGGKFKMIHAFLQLMRGKILTYPATTYFTCDKVRFEVEKPCSVQLDGELYNELDFDVTLKQGLLFYR